MPCASIWFKCGCLQGRQCRLLWVVVGVLMGRSCKAKYFLYSFIPECLFVWNSWARKVALLLSPCLLQPQLCTHNWGLKWLDCSVNVLQQKKVKNKTYHCPSGKYSFFYAGSQYFAIILHHLQIFLSLQYNQSREKIKNKIFADKVQNSKQNNRNRYEDKKLIAFFLIFWLFFSRIACWKLNALYYIS